LDEKRTEQLRTIEGAPPDLLKPPPGCPFMPRCAFARAICKTMPPLDPVGGDALHLKACWIDVTDPAQQAYAERRRQSRIAAQQAALVELAETTAHIKDLGTDDVAVTEMAPTVASSEEVEEK
jgi:oligopeptide transport system ATP-binding protein